MKFKFFEHTADTKFQAYGETLEDAFKNAAEAMSYVITIDEIHVHEKIYIHVKGNDLKSLLYNFLEELLFLFDTKSFLLAKVDSITIKENELSATIKGDSRIERYDISGDVKAVTYNDMEIIQKPESVTLQVVLDL